WLQRVARGLATGDDSHERDAWLLEDDAKEGQRRGSRRGWNGALVQQFPVGVVVADPTRRRRLALSCKASTAVPAVDVGEDYAEAGGRRGNVAAPRYAESVAGAGG